MSQRSFRRWFTEFHACFHLSDGAIGCKPINFQLHLHQRIPLTPEKPSEAIERRGSVGFFGISIFHLLFFYSSSNYLVKTMSNLRLAEIRQHTCCLRYLVWSKHAITSTTSQNVERVSALLNLKKISSRLRIHVVLYFSNLLEFDPLTIHDA